MKKETYAKIEKEIMGSEFKYPKFLNLTEEEKALVIESEYIAQTIERIGTRIQYSTEYTPGFIDEVWRIARKEDAERRLVALKENNKYLRKYLADMKRQIEEVQSNI